MADGFLGRWAKRKNDALQGKPLDEPVPGRAGAADSVAPAKGAALGVPGASTVAGDKADKGDKGGKDQKAATGAEPAEPASALPTLDDVQGLTKDSDFKPFMNKAVEPGVRNAAMKKLFADPHFNVMDRMDIYIDDYSQPDPLPASMLRQMASAKFLKLFDDEEEQKEDQKKGQTAGSDAASPEAVAETNLTPVTAAEPPSDDNPQPPGTSAELDPHQDNHAHSDLRLQPDHAAESPDPGRGAA